MLNPVLEQGLYCYAKVDFQEYIILTGQLWWFVSSTLQPWEAVSRIVIVGSRRRCRRCRLRIWAGYPWITCQNAVDSKTGGRGASLSGNLVPLLHRCRQESWLCERRQLVTRRIAHSESDNWVLIKKAKFVR